MVGEREIRYGWGGMRIFFLMYFGGFGLFGELFASSSFCDEGRGPFSQLLVSSLFLPQEWQPRLWLPCAALPCPLEAMEKDKPHARSALRGTPPLCSLLAAQANRDEFIAAVGAMYLFTSSSTSQRTDLLQCPFWPHLHTFLQFYPKLCAFCVFFFSVNLILWIPNLHESGKLCVLLSHVISLLRYYVTLYHVLQLFSQANMFTKKKNCDHWEAAAWKLPSTHYGSYKYSAYCVLG